MSLKKRKKKRVCVCVPAPSTHCKHIYCRTHRTMAGEFCGVALDKRGNHCRGCEVGGIVLKSHNTTVEWLKGTLERWHPGVQVTTERRVPRWDHPLPPLPDAELDAPPRRHLAVLDIRIREPGGRHRMLNVDVGFADPFTEDVAELRRRAEKPGRAAAAYVYAKQQRYPAWRNPTEDLVPFIIESFGHPSKKRPSTFFGSLRPRIRARVRSNYGAHTESSPASPNNASRGFYDRRKTTGSRTKLPS